jgi:hypothetical protein
LQSLFSLFLLAPLLLITVSISLVSILFNNPQNQQGRSRL